MVIVLKKEKSIEWQEGLNYNDQTQEAKDWCELFFCTEGNEPDVKMPISAQDERYAYWEWNRPAEGFKVRMNLVYPFQYPCHLQFSPNMENYVEITTIPVVVQ